MELRYSTQRAAVEAGSRRITGDAIVFNSPSEVLRDKFIGPFREIILPEAVDRTLRAADRVKALWNHDDSIVLGSTRAGTLRLRKDRHALSVEIFPPTWADAQLETIARGDVDGMSFRFTASEDGDKWERGVNGIPTRFVRDMQFSEVSIVTFPAYPETDVSVSQRSIESFVSEGIGGLSLDFARKLHALRIA